METIECALCGENYDANKETDLELYDCGEGLLFCNPCIETACHSHASLTAALDQCVEALEAASEVGEIKFGTCVLSRQVAEQIRAALDAAKKARGT